MSADNNATPMFSDLQLSSPLLQALEDAGYESPTPIQSRMIPHMLAGRDVVGQAQTGTGKTAAFALPLLMHLKTEKQVRPQILVLAPTRELALQVSDSFQQYGRHLDNFRSLAIFGGQDYGVQLSALKRGVQVIVGTPGRVMDHIRRGSLNLQHIHGLVLDEADEMLKMGFIDDVEWILEQIPASRQIALFSATMPQSIRRIAQKHLSSPVEITIETTAVTAPMINQRYISANGYARKLEALQRLLEVESFDAMLVFVRTKLQTMELAEALADKGYACAPLSGDIQQANRLRTIDQLKSGRIDILVATDVAARGLDVERISHVVNFDIPFDAEAYIHRVGRTGRAGRSGEAILFVHPREQRMLGAIEKLTRQKIAPMDMPSARSINEQRIRKFKSRISGALEADSTMFQTIIRDYQQEYGTDPLLLAAALARLVHGDRPFLMDETETRRERKAKPAAGRTDRPMGRRETERPGKRAITLPADEAMERYRLEVGLRHGVKPGNIVGAIANEADIESRHIGQISIFDDYSTVELPYGMPVEVFRLLQKVRINERPMHLSRIEASAPGAKRGARQGQPDRKNPANKTPRNRGKNQRPGQQPA
ncbi:DEAD/DEAH box helicase [Desulfoprunum benzoelyticum]|uniref:ATP-dependent RNA helicase DeaD n=1 Tax=Desulfoprunum benzoelyticum TaxID=1506996 RepID=A0A840US80_9BACT|nr:DEAD/DEAH box helicase [Desulfoprunum benzoelyticum]MBB5349077.1 ATP-dependent RNA helicase DeaD [Desulfoprunum benzoelyticum]MBM9531827.1 DEAD/DEAH box helicase [Desulfoprunum benzoelyticum]